MAEVTVAVLEVAQALSEISNHDGHYHAGACHEFRYFEGRYNYWYQGHWEYYDERSGTWYAY